MLITIIKYLYKSKMTSFTYSLKCKEMKDKAYKICSDYLSGSWKKISSADMVFKTVSGGLSNLLYYCSLPKTHTPLNGEPNQVILRMYGQLYDGKAEATITESVIFMMLSERKLGPKLYGIFPGGRLEEYISAHALTCKKMKEPEISDRIARKLAKVHSLQVPINKEPTWLFDQMSKWLKFIRNHVHLEKLSSEKQQLAKNLLSNDFESELNFLKKFLVKVESPVLFCHNDLQEGNILVPDQSGDEKLIFIDFEYCSYNYRGFDIANHFCEWCFNYACLSYPHFMTNLDNFPTTDQQLRFIRSYLKSFCINEEFNMVLNTEENILKEVEVFTLSSHFLWTLWSIYNSQNSQITFGYWEYGVTRFEAYLKHKSLLMKNWAKEYH